MCNFLKEFLPPVIETIEKLKDQDDDIEIQVSADNVYSTYELTVKKKGNAERQLVDNFLAGDGTSLAKILEMYPRQSSYVHTNFQTILATVKNLPNHTIFQFMELVEKIIEHNPSIIDEEFLEYTLENLEGENSNFVLNVTYSLMSNRKDLFVNYHKRLANFIKSSHPNSIFVVSNLPQLAETEELATFYTNLIWEIFYKVKTEHRSFLLSALQGIVCKFKQPVAIYKDELLKLKDGPMVDQVQYIINVIEGRSLEGIANILDDHQDELENLDVRVTDNSGKIVELDSDLVKTKEKIENVKEDLEMMKNQVQKIEYNIENLDERVEKLSHMTLSHAPSWSRHLSDLMNKPSDNDWRLLALKLNYSVDDVRNWATQPDPCLSLIDEWFATNNTKEATFAILKNLKDMNRLDAAEIVENALESVKSIIEDKKVEMIEKPKVFISYQWGHQEEVKLLCKHLEQAGFKAWMDIGQMGGGDSLFQKIDDGIRSAQVILSCVSLKYAKSTNCCREINLSANLGKAIIPLLMEDLSWPPSGPLGPILAEYLYIKFYQKNEKNNNQNIFWHPEKFQELLMQLRFHLEPNMELIKKGSPYFGWTKHLKKEQHSNESEMLKGNSPPLFISYQWDNQKLVTTLCRSLLEKGFECWLDIAQMGGGDSLFDKIDNGVRRAKLIISCVTQKYSQSVNCKREIGLSSELGKPIVPVLLENIKWPPEGPMSKAFTDLKYINFSTVNDRNIGDSDEFMQLLHTIDFQLKAQRRDALSKKNKQSEEEKQQDNKLGENKEEMTQRKGENHDNERMKQASMENKLHTEEEKNREFEEKLKSRENMIKQLREEVLEVKQNNKDIDKELNKARLRWHLEEERKRIAQLRKEKENPTKEIKKSSTCLLL
ncbi:DgyrCDS14397 [Dimorphilus gyrociliatus]|uniref:DgyrCDS14397 n=1 Tax=Dimorphilus gyrociliatus TaxID=2664684 RepID=A0A7I8WDS4_9ANNE|nr:DgyrCDS14397 [Dimorphilus gyrociliatus]